jgi:succinate-acetate transporter protein
MATVSDPQTQPRTAASPSASAMQGWVPANPAPLGLFGFGITTAVLSFINANLVGTAPATYPLVLGLAIAFGGLAQLLAGMWEFRSGNAFGAVAFSSFGAFWISFFFLVNFDVAKIATPEVNSALGLWLIAWGVFTACLFLCTFASPRSVQLLFLLLTATFIVLGIGQSGGHTTTIHIGGYIGIATAVVAVYTATAELMKGVYGHSMLPIGEPAPRTPDL